MATDHEQRKSRVRAAEQTSLDEHFMSLSPEERVRQFYYDSNTGLPNERGWEVIAESRIGPQDLFVQYSIEGVAWVNDAFTHEKGQRLYRAAAEALHKVDNRIAKVGGDFGGRVESREDAKLFARAATRMLPAEYQGFTITAASGDTWERATKCHERYKKLLERRGARAERGTRPKGLATKGEWEPVLCAAWLEAAADKEVPGRVNARTHDELKAAYGALAERSTREQQPYRDQLTGLLAPRGMQVLAHEGDQVLSIDVDGLGTTNTLKKELGDEVLRRVGTTIAKLQEQAGVAYNAAHPHGDEFLAAHPDAEALRDLASKLRSALASVQVTYTDGASGRTYVQDGVRFSYGIGPTRDVADGFMNKEKLQRAKERERDVKGKSEIARSHLSGRRATTKELDAARARDAERLRATGRFERVPLGKDKDGPMVSRMKRIRQRPRGRGEREREWKR